MVHAYAIDPEVVPQWADLNNYRFIISSFGLGTPRLLLEYPGVHQWIQQVDSASSKIKLSSLDQKRLDELLVFFAERPVRRSGTSYTQGVAWVTNAVQEYNRRAFAAIIASSNPQNLTSIITNDQLGTNDTRWHKPMSKTPGKAVGDLAAVVEQLLENASEVHFIDPHFGPDSPRYKDAIVALLDKCCHCPPTFIHCKAAASLTHFDQEAKKLGSRIAKGIRVRFKRWEEKTGGERFHNRYILTDIGGVVLGDGVGSNNSPGYTDDVNLMSREQYDKRWAQFCGASPAFSLVDKPADVIGTRT